MSSDPSAAGGWGLSRREFVQAAAAAASASLLANLPTWAQDAAGEARPQNADEVAVAIIGPGSQGRLLVNFCLKIPGVRFVAVCDIWSYNQKYAQNLLGKYDQKVTVYDDYREMLEKEKHLDAVIVATPDWMHAEHAIACLQAGKHVYCEKEMSNSLEKAREMVAAAEETGKLLQIGHQRRSSPRYWHALKMIEKDGILGRMTHTYAQWNRAQLLDIGWPEKYTMKAEELSRWGYGSMEELCNWRWYRKFSGGPLADLGSHQIDIFNWFLKASPRSVLASAGLDFYNEQPGRDWFDNMMTIYEYPTAAGLVRGFYQVLNTTSVGGFYEQFMGNEGALVISDDGKTGYVYREQTAKRREWEDEAEMIEKMGRDAIELKIGETLTPEGKQDPQAQALVEASKKDSRLLHLENFFAAVRGGAELTCPAKVAYDTCVTVLRANQAAEKGCVYTYDPKEFTA